MNEIQTIILLTGAVSAWLVQETVFNRRRWASIIALIGQPLWLYETLRAGQLGMFLLSLFYMLAWGRGFWLHWIKNNAESA